MTATVDENVTWKYNLSEWKEKMKDSLLHAYVVVHVKTSNLVVSRRRYAEDRKHTW